MNEQQSMQEKEFRSILSRLQGFGDERDKLINEIDDILDRLCRNRKPMVEPKMGTSSSAKDSEEVVVTILQVRLREMDMANERLKAISNRLNELV